MLQRNFGKEVLLNGHPPHRLPNTLNGSFIGRVGSEILAPLDGVAASTGAACHTGSVELSRGVRADGIVGARICTFFLLEIAIASTAIVRLGKKLFEVGVLGKKADRSVVLSFGSALALLRS